MAPYLLYRIKSVFMKIYLLIFLLFLRVAPSYAKTNVEMGFTGGLVFPVLQQVHSTHADINKGGFFCYNVDLNVSPYDNPLFFSLGARVGLFTTGTKDYLDRLYPHYDPVSMTVNFLGFAPGLHFKVPSHGTVAARGGVNLLLCAEGFNIADRVQLNAGGELYGGVELFKRFSIGLKYYKPFANTYKDHFYTDLENDRPETNEYLLSMLLIDIRFMVGR